MLLSISEAKDKVVLKCKICGKDFKSFSGLHIHLSRIHNVTQAEYYKKYYPKKSLLLKRQIPFKNYQDYMSRDFINKSEFLDWCEKSEPEKVKKYLKSKLKNRIESKSLKHALSEIELELCDFPAIDVYRNLFGSYSLLCEELGLNNILNKKIPCDFFDFKDKEGMKIFVDTREQKPINFINSESMKLDFGDYTAASPYYDYTYIDRKSEGDLKSTLSGSNFERFKKELARARLFNSYVFVVVESSIDKIKKNNVFSPHKSKLPYIWHNLKTVSQEYKDCCQFVFAENRAGLKKLIPKILLYGKKLWNVDVQYFLNKKIHERAINRTD
tara:strand:- start:3757 stop:4740 length:984 start_codon:yes stop_codon:yes gene_type:complete